MPISPTYPGVYVEEIPSGVRTITGVATSITAFIGRATDGPVNEPVIMNSMGDFERNMGGVASGYPMTYAVEDFFANGGGQAVIVRLFEKYDPAAATGHAVITLDDTILQASTPGTWGSSLTVTVDYLNANNADVLLRYGYAKDALFNLTFQLPDGTKELIRNVAVAEGSRRLDLVLRQESQLFTAQKLGVKRLTEVAASPVTTPGADSAALSPTTYKGDENKKTGIFALKKTDLFNLLCIPPDKMGDEETASDVLSAALTYCVKRRAMLVVDAPKAALAAGRQMSDVAKDVQALGFSGTDTRNAAVFFPRIRRVDEMRNGLVDSFAPCGAIAGLMARTDVQRGVWKAPAGIDAGIAGIRGFTVNLDDGENGQLNPLGINCLRTFPVVGNVCWGARTMRGADLLADDYKYISVRRLALYIEESLFRGTQWVVFEPNDEPLWAQIRLNVGAFMHNLFRMGAFQGRSPKEAYFVKCDSTTTTQNDINLGIVNIVVGFAPLKPAEFVVIQLQQMQGQIDT